MANIVEVKAEYTAITRNTFERGINIVIDEVDDSLLEHYIGEDANPEHFVQIWITPEIINSEVYVSDAQLLFINKLSGEITILEHVQPIRAEDMDFSINDALKAKIVSEFIGY